MSAIGIQEHRNLSISRTLIIVLVGSLCRVAGLLAPLAVLGVVKSHNRNLTLILIAAATIFAISEFGLSQLQRQLGRRWVDPILRKKRLAIIEGILPFNAIKFRDASFKDETRRAASEIKLAELRTTSRFVIPTNVLFLVSFMTIMVTLSPELTAILLLYIILTLSINKVFEVRRRKLHSERVQSGADADSVIEKYLRHFQFYYFIGKDKTYFKHLEHSMGKVYESGIASKIYESTTEDVDTLLRRFAILGIISYGAFLVETAALSFETLLIFSLLCFRAQQPIVQLIRLYREFGRLSARETVDRARFRSHASSDGVGIELAVSEGAVHLKATLQGQVATKDLKSGARIKLLLPRSSQSASAGLAPSGQRDRHISWRMGTAREISVLRLADLADLPQMPLRDFFSEEEAADVKKVGECVPIDQRVKNVLQTVEDKDISLSDIGHRLGSEAMFELMVIKSIVRGTRRLLVVGEERVGVDAHDTGFVDRTAQKYADLIAIYIIDISNSSALTQICIETDPQEEEVV